MGFNNLGDRLLKLRKEAEMYQREVAEDSFVSTEAYSAYERNEHIPPLDAIERLADVFNVAPQYIVGWSQERKG